jgi:hypothetical protein
MSTASAPRARRVEGLVPERLVLGVALFAIGGVVLAGFAIQDLDRWTLAGVSIVSLVAFALTREYGFAIPAGITGGLGAMVLLASSGSVDPASEAAAVLLPFAAGFLGVWVLGLVARPREIHPWPLVPAAIIGLVGLANLARQPMAIGWIQAGIALALVAAGIVLVLRRDR